MGGAWVHFRSHRSFVQCIEYHFNALCRSYTHSGFYPCVAGWKDLRSLRALHTSSASPGHHGSQELVLCRMSSWWRSLSPVHMGPSGSVPETIYMTSNGPQLLPSSVKDPYAHPPPPVEPYESFLLRTRSLYRGTLMERQGLSPLPVPFPTFDACPGIGPHIRALSAPPGLRMPLPRHLYIPPLSAWQWPGRDVGSSPVTGQPAQLAPPPGPSAPTTCFPDTVGRPSTVLLPQFQAVVPGTRPSSPPTPVVSAASMPRPVVARVSASCGRGPPSDGLHTSAWRYEAPSTCPGLPSSLLHPASSHVITFHWTSRSAGLCSASDHGETDDRAASTGEGRSPGGFVIGRTRCWTCNPF